MLKQIILPVLLLTFSLTVCLNCEKNKDRITGPLKERETGNTADYIVYSKILSPGQDCTEQIMVISDSTIFIDLVAHSEYIKSHFPELLDETIDNYMTKNQQKTKLLNIPDLDKSCYLIDEEKKQYWKELYPGADILVQLSRVGFNAANDQALVFYSKFRGALSASGNIAFLVKMDGEWVISNEKVLWQV